MSDIRELFADNEFVRGYLDHGPPAFTPGHAGVLQMAAVLLREHAPADAHVLVAGAGGGLETRTIAELEPHFRFTGFDPAPQMLALAREVLGESLLERVELVEGTVDAAPAGPFDAGTCVLVIGLLPDDGAKLNLLRAMHRRLKPGAPFILVDQCLDRASPGFAQRLDRYAAYALASGVGPDVVEKAREAMTQNPGLVAPERDEALLDEAGFQGREVFYVGMSWRGWLALA